MYPRRLSEDQAITLEMMFGISWARVAEIEGEWFAPAETPTTTPPPASSPPQEAAPAIGRSGGAVASSGSSEP